MKLEDLIDLEAQLAADAAAESAALQQRDRAVLERIPEAVAQGDDRDALLSHWLRVLREDGAGQGLGATVTAGQRALGYTLAGSGVVSGWALAAALLGFEKGGTPVNVGTLLLCAVAIPQALLALGVLGLPLAARFPDVAIVGDIRALLRFVATKLEQLVARAERSLDAKKREVWRVARARLRSRASLYQPVERWVLFGLSQTFASAFALGLLLCAARQVVFSDIAFAWSTTVESIDARVVHHLCSALALPWGWAIPDAVPSLELIEKTQYFRLDGRFVGAEPGFAGDPRLAGQWWRFVVAVLATYGLAPRVAAFALARAMLARALRHLPLETAEVDRVVRRMRTPYVETRDAGTPSGGPEPARGVPPGGFVQQTRPSQPCIVVSWRGAPGADRVAQGLKQTFGLAVERGVAAGGADFSADEAVLEELAASAGPIVVVAEAWEPPDKSVRRFLADLRATIEPERKLLVALVGDEEAGAAEATGGGFLAIWRDRLCLLEDPYLSVEALGTPA